MKTTVAIISVAGLIGMGTAVQADAPEREPYQQPWGQWAIQKAIDGAYYTPPEDGYLRWIPGMYSDASRRSAYDDSAFDPAGDWIDQSRPGYRPEPTPQSVAYYRYIMEKVGRGEELTWADRLGVQQSIATRTWPEAPEITAGSQAVMDWAEREPEQASIFNPMARIQARARRRTSDAVWQEMTGAGLTEMDTPPTEGSEAFRQYWHSLSEEERQKLPLARMMRNWFARQGFDMRSDERRAQEEALIQEREQQRQQRKEAIAAEREEAERARREEKERQRLEEQDDWFRQAWEENERIEAERAAAWEQGWDAFAEEFEQLSPEVRDATWEGMDEQQRAELERRIPLVPEPAAEPDVDVATAPESDKDIAEAAPESDPDPELESPMEPEPSPDRRPDVRPEPESDTDMAQAAPDPADADYRPSEQDMPGLWETEGTRAEYDTGHTIIDDAGTEFRKTADGSWVETGDTYDAITAEQKAEWDREIEEAARDLRSEEPSSPAWTGPDSGFERDSPGGLLDQFADRRQADRQQQVDSAASTMDLSQQMGEAATRGDRQIRDARQTRSAAGRDAQITRDQAAREAAQAQRAQSWGTALGDAITDGVQQGMETMASTFGQAAADEAAGQIFGPTRQEREAKREAAAAREKQVASGGNQAPSASASRAPSGSPSGDPDPSHTADTETASTAPPEDQGSGSSDERTSSARSRYCYWCQGWSSSNPCMYCGRRTIDPSGSLDTGDTRDTSDQRSEPSGVSGTSGAEERVTIRCTASCGYSFGVPKSHGYGPGNPFVCAHCKTDTSISITIGESGSGGLRGDALQESITESDVFDF